jgi:hypothetical protein
MQPIAPILRIAETTHKIPKPTAKPLKGNSFLIGGIQTA